MIQFVLSPLRRYPMASFVVLAFLLSWRRWIESIVAGGPQEGLGSFGPFVAALLVVLATGGGKSALDLLRRLVRWRVAPRWYAFAIGLPIAVSAAAALIAVALGARVPSPAQLATFPQALASLPLVFLVGGPLGEEPGWRGFLQPRARARLGGPLSGLAVGVIWGLWHIPLLLSQGPAMQLAFFVEVVAVAVLLEQLDAGTGGSVLLAMLLHAMENAIGGGYVTAMFEGGDRLLLTIVRAALYTAVAAALVLRRRHATNAFGRLQYGDAARAR